MGETDHIQTVVVGAGVIGLAIARYLATHGHEVLILEAESAIGLHTSSRNSQVIHAGIYYPKGSDQQRLCVLGKEMLYDYCADRHVDHTQCGKLTVAPDPGKVPMLHELVKRGTTNGVDDLRVISKDELLEMEPEVSGAAAVVSPSTGIVDAPGLMLSLLGEAEGAGAALALQSPLKSVRRAGTEFILIIGDTDQTQIACTNLINAAALGAWDVAQSIEGLDPATIPTCNLAKGSYFSLAGKSPFNALIYPLPEYGHLGIHSVPDLGGGLRFGPNMEWVDEIDYSVDPELGPEFEGAVRNYWPALTKNSLVPDGAGVRPRIWGPSDQKQGFVFQGPEQHRIEGLIQLFGFESPGLTACLAIGKQVGEMLGTGKK